MGTDPSVQEERKIRWDSQSIPSAIPVVRPLEAAHLSAGSQHLQLELTRDRSWFLHLQDSSPEALSPLGKGEAMISFQGSNPPPQNCMQMSCLCA